MNKQKAGGLLFFMLVISGILFLNPNLIFAVYEPQPQSGGKFFEGKGTKSAYEYQYLGRTGTDEYRSNYYGKGVEYKNIRVKPYASYTGEWDTNVFLTEHDHKDDYINRLNWGASADVPLEGGKYVLGGEINSESEWFSTYDKEDHTDWNFVGRGAFNFNNFSVNVFNDFRDTSDRSGTELTSRVERKENYLDGLLEIPFGEFFLENEASYFYLNFDDKALDNFDRDDIRDIPRIGYNLGPRTQVLAEYSIMHIGYDHASDRNAWDHEWALGARGFLGNADLISYQVWGGWQIRNYNSDNIKDFSSFVFRANAEYRPSDLSRIFVDAHRTVDESVTQTNSFLVRNDLGAGWRRQLSENIGAELKGSIGFYDYSDHRRDFFWEPMIRFNYLLPGKFAHLFAEYRFSQRASDVENRSYTRNLLNFGIRAEI